MPVLVLPRIPCTACLPGARLIGIEYIVSERLFRELPEGEKRYWHSHRQVAYLCGCGLCLLVEFVGVWVCGCVAVHVLWQHPRSQACGSATAPLRRCHGHRCRYEVGSGLLVAPRVPGLAERQDMQKLIGTYGKTWHMWQVDRGDPLPYGGCCGAGGWLGVPVGGPPFPPPFHRILCLRRVVSSTRTALTPCPTLCLPSCRPSAADDGFHRRRPGAPRAGGGAGQAVRHQHRR